MLAPRTADVAIVGAGIVGLAAAMQLLIRRPDASVVVLDKEERVGAHQTGHNSGVLHRGVYYAPGSLKARMCVDGAEQLSAFCAEHEIPISTIGKLIIAAEERELPALHELHRRAVANGVPGVRLVGGDEIPHIEREAIGVGALHSPTTGIVDFGRVANAYADEIAERGGVLHLGWEVTGIRRFRDHVEVRSGHRLIRAAVVATCGGLQSDRLASMTDDTGRPRVQIVPFRGDYYLLRPQERLQISGLIYPVPDPRFPFLGVHFTPRMSGDVWLGPNAVLAFAREGYRRRDVSLRDTTATLTYAGFWSLARKYWRVGAAEMWRDVSRSAFAAALRRYVPAIRDRDLVGHAAGVRAQAVTEDGSLVDDFDIAGDDQVMHVRNAPSPAATSSLSIGAYLADQLLERLEHRSSELGPSHEESLGADAPV
jgi:(S)-2-hydroxyglutarate dehydrogenase